jgi:hypothetical protein
MRSSQAAARSGSVVSARDSEADVVVPIVLVRVGGAGLERAVVAVGEPGAPRGPDQRWLVELDPQGLQAVDQRVHLGARLPDGVLQQQDEVVADGRDLGPAVALGGDERDELLADQPRRPKTTELLQQRRLDVQAEQPHAVGPVGEAHGLGLVDVGERRVVVGALQPQGASALCQDLGAQRGLVDGLLGGGGELVFGVGVTFGHDEVRRKR